MWWHVAVVFICVMLGLGCLRRRNDAEQFSADLDSDRIPLWLGLSRHRDGAAAVVGICAR